MVMTQTDLFFVCFVCWCFRCTFLDVSLQHLWLDNYLQTHFLNNATELCFIQIIRGGYVVLSAVRDSTHLWDAQKEKTPSRMPEKKGGNPGGQPPGPGSCRCPRPYCQPRYISRAWDRLPRSAGLFRQRLQAGVGRFPEQPPGEACHPSLGDFWQRERAAVAQRQRGRGAMCSVRAGLQHT